MKARMLVAESSRPGPILLAILLASSICYCNARSRYAYILGHDDGVLTQTPVAYSSMTMFTPNVTSFPDFFIDGYLDFLSLTQFSGAAAVNESKLYTWGRAYWTGRNIDSSSVVGAQMVHDFSPAKIASLASGDTYAILVLDNGTVYSWGTNDRASVFNPSDDLCPTCQLGQSGPERTSLVLKPVDTSNMSLSVGEKVTKVMANSMCTYLWTNAGNVYTFGANQRYSLGHADLYDNSTAYTSIPRKVDLDAKKPQDLKVVQVDGTEATLYLLSDGSYMCYGAGIQYCTGDWTAPPGPMLPKRFLPPQGRIFKRVMSASYSSFAWDDQGDIWAFGDATYIPSADTTTQCGSAGTHVVCLPRKLSPIAGAKIVDLFYTDWSALFALTERNQLWRMTCAPWACSAKAWVEIPYQVPSGYILDFSRTTVTHFLFATTAKPLEPCQTTSPPFESPDFICSNGIWTLFSSATLNSTQTLVIATPTSIRGNLTIQGSTSINFDTGITSPMVVSGSSATGQHFFVSVDGCIDIQPGAQINVDLTQQTLGTPKKGQTYPFKQEEVEVGLFEYDASCKPPNLDALQVSITKPTTGPSCKKYKVGNAKLGDATERGTMFLRVFVDSGKCNPWWIVVASTLGCVFLAVAIVVILAYRLPKFRATVRPTSLKPAVHRASTGSASSV